MNAPLDQESEDLRYAEYVLGVLDADARAAVEREIASDPHAAAEVAGWQARLSPLTEDIPAATPPDRVWVRIPERLGQPQPSPNAIAAPRRGWWNSLWLWRGFAFGAAAVAVAFIIAFFVVPRTTLPPPITPHVAYMGSTITQTNGQVGWTATIDLQHARMIVVPARPARLPVGRAPELWLIPAGQKPIAVGMIDTRTPTSIRLDKALVAHLAPTAALAVSIEPPGGSPTGQPTGPVIATGTIGAAAQASGKPVAMLYPRIAVCPPVA